MREFLETPLGRWLGIGFAGIALVVIGFMLLRSGSDVAAESSAERMYVDAVTLKPFEVSLRPGMPSIVRSADGNDSYPAEACYWNPDGTEKAKPTWVLHNSWIGKREPTFCPDCDRLVTPQNPRPDGNRKAPLTRAEYSSRPARPGNASAYSDTNQQ